MLLTKIYIWRIKIPEFIYEMNASQNFETFPQKHFWRFFKFIMNPVLDLFHRSTSPPSEFIFFFSESLTSKLEKSPLHQHKFCWNCRKETERERGWGKRVLRWFVQDCFLRPCCLFDDAKYSHFDFLKSKDEEMWKGEIFNLVDEHALCLIKLFNISMVFHSVFVCCCCVYFGRWGGKNFCVLYIFLELEMGCLPLEMKDFCCHPDWERRDSRVRQLCLCCGKKNEFPWRKITLFLSLIITQDNPFRWMLMFHLILLQDAFFYPSVEDEYQRRVRRRNLRIVSSLSNVTQFNTELLRIAKRC